MCAFNRALILCIGNIVHLEQLLQFVMQMAADCSDSPSQKGAFTFLGRCVAAWAHPTSETPIPLERFIYDHLVPLIFKVPSMPQFNIKDGQVAVVGVLYILIWDSILTLLSRLATK
jgi:exportin-T